MNILTINNPKEKEFLNKKTKEINLKTIDKKFLRTTIQQMRKIMKESNGVGLSANQVGLDLKFFIAQVYDSQGKPKFYAILNPKIVKKSNKKIIQEEGCLSVPGIFEPTPRYDYVILEGYDLNFKKIKIKAWGLLARIFQHEVDHLNGKLFLDHIKK
ncbi:MAG: peptide deformylase [Minisyncoccia bacterium]